MNKNQDKSDK